MMLAVYLVFLLAVVNSSVSQQGLPFQVNSQKTCTTQISIDSTTISGIKRGDANAACSGYLMYTAEGKTRQMCAGDYYEIGFTNFVAERACYTLGVNFFRDSSLFDASRTRQMKLYRCFSYQEQNAERVDSEGGVKEVFDLDYRILDRTTAGCTDYQFDQADPDVYDCFDTCYLTGDGPLTVTTEEGCGHNVAFYTLGCADINECLNGVMDYCTGPFDSSCTIRKACGNNTDCTNYQGSFECSCKNGYEYRSGDSFDPYDLNEGCKDVDECKQSPCDVNAKCVNTHGSYLCLCRDGFVGDGKSCTPIICHTLPELANAQYKHSAASYGGYGFGDTSVYECDEGYKVSVQDLPETLVNYYGYTTTHFFTLTCDENGDWGPYPIPQCRPVDCGDPGMIPNAKRDGTGFMFDQWVTYTCEDGFRPEQYGTKGSFTRKCQADGTWTEGTTCVDVDECEESGVCTAQQYCINIKGSYLCLTGTPDNCGVQGFCKNGNCRLENGRAECVCDAGYSGLRCETSTTGIALILSIIAIVLFGILTIILLVCFCMRCWSHPKTLPACPPQGVVNPVVVGRAPFPTKAYGFSRPTFALAATPTCESL